MRKSSSLRHSLNFILLVTLVSIPLSGVFDTSAVLLNRVPWYLGVFIVVAIVLVGAFFDMIGVAAAAAVETPFHAMASERIFGAKLAVRIIRNAEKVASICSDLIGDIAGVLSGAAALAVGEQIGVRFGLSGWLSHATEIALTILATALTIGAKACGKTLAVYYPTPILLMVSRIGAGAASVFTWEKRGKSGQGRRHRRVSGQQGKSGRSAGKPKRNKQRPPRPPVKSATPD